MEYTQITQDCYGVTTGPETEEFRVETTVNSAGELPTTALFVYTISDAEDAATDAFARVGNPQDIQNLLEDRDEALLASATEYLSSYAELQYADLDVAIQAKAMFSSRIDDLVKKWIQYTEEFVVGSEVPQLYPTAASSVEDALREDYASAKEDREAAEVVAAAASVTKDNAETAITTTEELVAAYQKSVDFYTPFYTTLNTYHDEITHEGTVAGNIWTNNILPDIEGFIASSNADLQFQVSTLSAKQSDFQTATTEKIEADTVLAAAESAEDEALAALLAVCPDFDPASV